MYRADKILKREIIDFIDEILLFMVRTSFFLNLEIINVRSFFEEK